MKSLHKKVSLLISLLLVLLLKQTATSSTGLTMKLILPNSPESPFYMKNMTRKERVHKLASSTMARANSHSQGSKPYRNNNSFEILRVRPKFHVLKPHSMIVVELGIGTFKTASPYKYYLQMDTASELIWLQCEDCLHKGRYCFHQFGPPFPNSKSNSYHPLPCDRHSLCYPGECFREHCSYHIEYYDDLNSKGIIASETFVFASSSGSMETIPNLVFGCGIDNADHVGTTHGEAGILGLGWGPRSFISQLKNQIDERFSYCLPHGDRPMQGSYSYLTFGADIVMEEGFSATPLRRVPEKDEYYFDIEGISVAGVRLDIPKSLLALKPDGTGGTIIDSGSTYTLLIRHAYNKVKDAVIAYMKSLRNYRRKFFGKGGFDLCYIRRRAVHDTLPSIPFHCRGADLVIPPENVFVWLDHHLGNELCLAVLTHDSLTLIGSYPQGNIRFVYDRRKMVLLFKPENCRMYP